MSTTDGAAEAEGPKPGEVEYDPALRALQERVQQERILQERVQQERVQQEQALQEAVDQAQDRWQRAVAELDNVRKRCARQLVEARAAGRAEAASHWLPVVDNLERALESAARADPGDPIIDGVRAVRDQAVSVLAGLGFARHDEARVPFDPYRHEAVGVDYDADAEPGTVVQVVRAGYGEGERQLRPAGVVVAGQRG